MRGVVVVLVLLSHPAWADRVAAQQLASDAEKSGEPAAFVACGQAFLDVYNQDPASTQADEVLFDAARCFEAGKSIAAALESYAILIKNMPTSRSSAKAMVRSGRLYEQVASFDRAAARYEEYAHKYAGEHDAADVMGSAIRLRGALGDVAQQLEDTNYLIKTYGSKQLTLAAKAELALLPALGGDQAITLLRTYLREFATADADDTIRAHVELGDRLRAKSCPIKAIDGLCVELRIDRGPHCGAVDNHAVAFTRSVANRDAIAEYGQAIKLYEAGQRPASRHAYAMAKLALADDKLETMLAVAFPHDLDVGASHTAAHATDVKRFSMWFDNEQKLGAAASEAYQAIMVERDPVSAVAAAARLGQTSKAFWRTILGAEIPRSLRSNPVHDAYCSQLSSVSDALKARAIEVFSICIEQAGELGVAEDWAELCWREGAQLDPIKFAAPKELRAALRDTPPIAIEPALTPPQVPSP